MGVKWSLSVRSLGVKEWASPSHKILLLNTDGALFGTFSAIWLSLLLTLLLLEFHVPIMHHSSCQLVNGHLFIIAETQDIHSTLERVEFNSPHTYYHGRLRTLLLFSDHALSYLTNVLSFSRGTRAHQHFPPHSNTNRYVLVFPLSYVDSKDVL